MRINTNVAALNTYGRLSANQANANKSLEKLSSGLRINKAGDDAAGLAISEKMRSQIRGLSQANRNAQDGISMIQTAEGAMNETHSILQRMRELVVQAGNGTNQAEDKSAINAEITALQEELDGISTRTEFNGQKLLDGSLNTNLQIGANAGQSVSVTVANMNASTLGVDSTKVDVTDFTTNTFTQQLDAIDTAIGTVSTARSGLGAVQNRLEHTINNLSTATENLTAAESRVRDVDMAAEMMQFTKNNILTQAATAMLAQANQTPQGVLQLLR